MNDDPNREFKAKVNKNKNSIWITLPPYLKELYDIETGDWISLSFNKVVKKAKVEDRE